jgi:TolB-like protein/Tfp pilus assembly protein PilF
MAEEHRKLAVIMFTDIVGYTALAQQDESLALELLTEHNHLLRESFAAYDGREIKCTGDGFLVVFESPVQSAQCAMEIQSHCAQRNGSVDRKRVFQIRIGIHLGDVVHRGQDVFGDGVNVASRIEPLAEPGGICISRQVHDQVWNKISAKFTSLGRKELKNLRARIEVFRVTPSATGKPVLEQDRTRIAVLPLMNISPDSSDAYFTDGMTEELIYTLSKLSNLHVIANTSSMRYKNSDKSIADIGQELQVGSVLEGSVRKAGNLLRITVQLISVANQEHVWSERYDRALEDVFAIQSDIAQRVAEALEVRLLVTERHGIELDPDYALAYAGLAEHYFLLPEYSDVNPIVVLPQAQAAANRALEIDSTVAQALTTVAMLRLLQDRDPSASERGLKHVIRLHPNSAEAHRLYGMILMCLDRRDEAIEETEKALELDPLSLIANRQLGLVLCSARLYDKAIEALQKALELDPHFSAAHLTLGCAYLAKGMHEEALAEFEQETALPRNFVMPYVGVVHVDVGRKGKALQILAESVEESKHGHTSVVPLAALCFALGEKDQGFRYLEKACEEGDMFLRILQATVSFDSVRSDPRFISLLKRMGLDA